MCTSNAYEKELRLFSKVLFFPPRYSIREYKNPRVSSPPPFPPLGLNPIAAQPSPISIAGNTRAISGLTMCREVDFRVAAGFHHRVSPLPVIVNIGTDREEVVADTRWWRSTKTPLLCYRAARKVTMPRRPGGIKYATRNIPTVTFLSS